MFLFRGLKRLRTQPHRRRVSVVELPAAGRAEEQVMGRAEEKTAAGRAEEQVADGAEEHAAGHSEKKARCKLRRGGM